MGCYKGMTHIHFNPRCKLVYACNETPRSAVVKGLDRRIEFVEFLCKFVDEPDPENPFEKQKDINIFPQLLKELTGIFNWAYAGYQDLMQTGTFDSTDEQARYIQQFKAIGNPILVFCEDHQFNGVMTRDEIYGMYTSWCESTGNFRLSREVFFPRFCEQMVKRIVYSGRRMYRGKRTMLIEFTEEFEEIDGATPFDA